MDPSDNIASVHTGVVDVTTSINTDLVDKYVVVFTPSPPSVVSSFNCVIHPPPHTQHATRACVPSTDDVIVSHCASFSMSHVMLLCTLVSDGNTCHTVPSLCGRSLHTRLPPPHTQHASLAVTPSSDTNRSPNSAHSNAVKFAHVMCSWMSTVVCTHASTSAHCKMSSVG